MSDNYKDLPLVEIFVDAPASASSPGVPGQVAFSAGFLFVCTDTNTWKRVAIGTW